MINVFLQIKFEFILCVRYRSEEISPAPVEAAKENRQIPRLLPRTHHDTICRARVKPCIPIFGLEKRLYEDANSKSWNINANLKDLMAALSIQTWMMYKIIQVFNVNISTKFESVLSLVTNE